MGSNPIIGTSVNVIFLGKSSQFRIRLYSESSRKKTHENTVCVSTIRQLTWQSVLGTLAPFTDAYETAMKFVSRADTHWHGSIGRRSHGAPTSAEGIRTTAACLFWEFLHEFRPRRRDQLLRQPAWRICFERARGFALRQNVRPYPAGVAVVVACAAVISITIYQQPEPAQVAVQGSPVPSTPPANAEREFNFAPPAVLRTFNPKPILLPRSRDIPLIPVDPLRSDEFVPLNLERESFDDQPLLEK
jgi:hypothetical protein